MKLIQIINLCKGKIQNMVKSNSQNSFEGKNKNRVCIKLCLQVKGNEVVSELLNYGSYVVENLNKLGVDACLEEEAHQDFLASHSDELSFMYVDSKAYRSYLKKNFGSMLVIMIYGNALERNMVRLIYYNMQNTGRPFADQCLQNLGLDIKPILEMVKCEKEHILAQIA